MFKHIFNSYFSSINDKVLFNNLKFIYFAHCDYLCIPSQKELFKGIVKYFKKLAMIKNDNDNYQYNCDLKKNVSISFYM